MTGSRFAPNVSFCMAAVLSSLGCSDSTGPPAEEKLGPFSPWLSPVNLGPVINSTGNDQASTFSSDGLTLYFSSDRAGDFDIYVARRANTQAPWQAPVRLGGAVNGSGREPNSNLSSDGRSLYLTSDRAGGCGGLDLWRSSRTDVTNNDGWQPPVNLGCSINTTFDDAGPDLFVDRARGTTRLYYIEQNRPDGLGDFDIFASSLGANGTFGAGAMVSELSTASRDGRTATRRDGLEIFFFSNRPGGSGLVDLWVATRASTADPWSTPTNLGPSVNTASDEATPAISADGTTIVFNSTRPGGAGLHDLYIMTRTRS